MLDTFVSNAFGGGIIYNLRCLTNAPKCWYLTSWEWDSTISYLWGAFLTSLDKSYWFYPNFNTLWVISTSVLFCLYWASGDCHYTMWLSSLSVLCTSHDTFYLSLYYTGYVNIWYRHIWTDTDVNCNLTGACRHTTIPEQDSGVITSPVLLLSRWCWRSVNPVRKVTFQWEW